MKAIILFLLAAASIFVSGCDHMNWQQYRIANVPMDSPDVARVKSVLKEVAEKTGLEDRRPSSRVTNTLVFYVQPGVLHFRVDLGARRDGDSILVGLVGGFGPIPPVFTQAEHLLTPALTNAFGSRLSVPDPRVPIQ